MKSPSEFRRTERDRGIEDPFGLFAATKEKKDGYFAVFEIDGRAKATPIYTEETLNKMVIPDVLKKHPNSRYKIFPESEKERIMGTNNKKRAKISIWKRWFSRQK